jgi:hypothetical protein
MRCWRRVEAHLRPSVQQKRPHKAAFFYGQWKRGSVLRAV